MNAANIVLCLGTYMTAYGLFQYNDSVLSVQEFSL